MCTEEPLFFMQREFLGVVIKQTYILSQADINSCCVNEMSMTYI